MLRNCIAILNLFILASCSEQQKKQEWKLVWNDEFEYSGLPDSSKWSFESGGHGWGNNELEYYTAADTSNAVVRNGELIITARKQQKDSNQYTSARLRTKDKGDWLYGKFEVKARLPKGRGMWPAIWMLPTDWAYGDWPESGEIDIMENVGFMPDSVFSTVHTRSFNHVIHTQRSKGLFFTDLYTSFHVYAMEWGKDKITFSVDNKPFFHFDNSGKGFAEWPFDKRFHLLMNIAVGGDWGGARGVDEHITASSMEVDYVRVYQK